MTIGPRARLVALSFLMLFVELALIRWAGSNVVYLSYFSNFVLLGSFLGIGVGFLRAHARRDLFPWAPVAIGALLLFVRFANVHVDRSGSDIIYFGSTRQAGLPTWIVLPVIFLAVAVVMEMIAEAVARAFTAFPPLQAYRLDILGSLAGIVAFSAVSFLGAPPIVWGVVAAAGFLLLAARRMPHQVLGVLVMLGVLLAESFGTGFSWSPYYRVKLEQTSAATWRIDVNGIPHQEITSAERRRRVEPIYTAPYQRVARAPKRVLIIGAGSGTDTAIALSEGVEHVDAVEIDPRIQRIGAQLHPDRPYDDPRVTVHIDDGRAFLERTDARYDLILFALPDSLTLVAGQSSLRLESYLFTEEAFRSAREHLAPGGVFGMYNFYRERWLVDRLAGTLQRAFGHAPCIDEVGQSAHLAALVVGLAPSDTVCATTWATVGTTSARDDHPFVYLRHRSIPRFYLLAIGMILLASLLLTRAAGGPLRAMSPYTDLFFMGAAFLLLETKNVVQFALLFGTTWFVNALVFGGVLVAVLAAIEITSRARLPKPGVLYALLFASLAASYAVPASALLALPFATRLAVGALVAFLPITLANIIFAQRFKDVGSSTTAFGANLLGAMVGGVLEYVSLLTGYRALLIAVAALYLGALLTRARATEQVTARA